MAFSLGANLTRHYGAGAIGKGLTTRMAVGGLAGAILGDDAGDIMTGAALGALGPSVGGMKNFVQGGKVLGKQNKTLGAWSSKASKMPWARMAGGATIAGVSSLPHMYAQSNYLNQYYTSQYGDTPATQKTLEAMKGVGKATMATGMIGGGLYGAFGITPLSPFRAPAKAAKRAVVGGSRALPGFGRGLVGAKQKLGFSPLVGGQPGYGAGRRWSPFGGPRVPTTHAWQNKSKAGSNYERTQFSSMERRVYGQTAGGRALHSPLSNRLFGSSMGRKSGGAIQRWRKSPMRFGGKGPNRLGPVGRHPYWSALAVGGALGAGRGFFNASRTRQMQTGSGRIIGMDSGTGGGINPSLNFSTQGLGLNIHNRRRRRSLE